MRGRRPCTPGTSASDPPTAAAAAAAAATVVGPQGEGEVDEAEPRLSYTRVEGSVPQIVAEGASCLCASSKLIALGTNEGSLCVLDFNGNEVRRFRSHAGRVNDVCLSESGEYVGSCGEDGTVVIHGLYTDETFRQEYHRPMRALALDPSYDAKRCRQFVGGGATGQLLLSTKGWVGMRDQVLHEGEGPVRAVKWSGNIIAWANNVGVKMYDSIGHRRVTFISREAGVPSPDAYPPHLCWESRTSLLIGWAHAVKVAHVASRPGPGEERVYFVEIVASFTTDYSICGIAGFGRELVVLAWLPAPDDSSGGEAQGGVAVAELGTEAAVPGAPPSPPRPRRAPPKPPPLELRVVSRAGEVASRDILSAGGGDGHRARDLSLAAWVPPYAPPSGGAPPRSLGDPPEKWWADGDDPLLYVVAPKEIVLARPQDASDRVMWLLGRGRFEEALGAAEAQHGRGLRAGLLEEVREQYLDHLVAAGDFKGAAELSPRILRGNAPAWERCVFAFAHHRQLPALAPFIPTGEPRLREAVYEMVLNSFLATPSARPQLLETLQRWPRDLYSVPLIIENVLEHLNSPAVGRAAEGGEEEGEGASSPREDPVLREALAELYIVEGKRDLALGMYLKLQRPGVFQFIRAHGLFSAVRDKVLLLLQLDAPLAVALLVEHRAEVDPGVVVAQIQAAGQAAPGSREMLHSYLHALFLQDPHAGCDFHALQVELYAELEPAQLMGFLSTSQTYPLERALEICQRAGMAQETVYILGRMGNAHRALGIIVNDLKDIQQAIHFVEAQRDEELWEDLIEVALPHPELVGELLEHLGGHVDPLRLLRRIPEGMPIPALRDRLIRVVADYRTNMSLRQGCNDILRADCACAQALARPLSPLALPLAAAAGFADRRPRFAGTWRTACTRARGWRCGWGTSGVPRPGEEGGVGGEDRHVVAFYCAHSYHLNCLDMMAAPLGAPKGAGGGGGEGGGARDMKKGVLSANTGVVVSPASSPARERGGGDGGGGEGGGGEQLVSLSVGSGAARLRCILCQAAAASSTPLRWGGQAHRPAGSGGGDGGRGTGHSPGSPRTFDASEPRPKSRKEDFWAGWDSLLKEGEDSLR